MLKNNVFPCSKLNEVSLVSYIEFAPTFFYPLTQGCSQDPRLVVKVNQKVSSGDIIARAKKIGSQNIHSAVGGTVMGVRSFRYAGNYTTTQAVEINFGGVYKTFDIDNAVSVKAEKMNPEHIVTNIVYSGVFDQDSGSVDTRMLQILLAGNSTIIINATEVSPFLMLEEKILQMHVHEISYAVQMLMRLMSFSTKKSMDKGPRVFICSNNAKSRKMTLKMIRNHIKYPFSIVATPIGLDVDDEVLVNENNRFVFHKLFNETNGKYKNNMPPEESTFIVRPSTLLAIYEAIFLDKPFIEKYMQIITGQKKSFVVKAPIGLPLYYLMQQSKAISPQAEHFFTENFIRRESLFDFTTPVSKHISHLFILTDKDFSSMYNTVSKHVLQKQAG